MTFSIVARCASNGMFGLVVASSSPAVAARCAHARAGVGAMASQNATDPGLGRKAPELLSRGASAAERIAIIRHNNAHMERRQLLMVDQAGGAAIHSGTHALGVWAEAKAENVACGGNLLSSRDVPEAMVASFLSTSGPLGERLILAKRAALAAGGEAGPVHSAGTMLVHEVTWPVADLRVDWTDACPVAELASLWERYKPQLDAYVTRALNHTTAPSYWSDPNG